MSADGASDSASGVNAERVVTIRAEWPYHCLSMNELQVSSIGRGLAGCY